MRLASTLSHRAPLGQVIEQARLVDGLGYESIWIPEILGRDALTTVALLGPHVQQAGLATGVVPLGVRSATTLAMAAAALAEALPGRFTLGVGAGHPEIQPRGFGSPALRRTEDVGTYLSVLLALLERRPVDAPRLGIETQLRDVHMAEPPRIVLAALRPAMIQLGVATVGGILMNWVTPDYAAAMSVVVREAAEQAGRDPDAIEVACYVPTCVTDDLHAARLAVANQLRAYGRLGNYRGLWDDAAYERVRAGVDADGSFVLARPSLVDDLAAIGHVDDVQARLATFRAAGITLPIVAPVAVGDDPWGSMLATWIALAPTNEEGRAKS